MGDTAIRVENVCKRYRIGQRQRYKTLRDALFGVMCTPFRGVRACLSGQGTSKSYQESDNFIWALKDVSFEVKRGEVIGVVGRNGAGKSTLLKILSRITKPTKGFAEIHGRVGSLLEVGTGFHPELTGRENIYLNGAILGIKRKDIDRRFDEILAFAEVEKFIDTPVKHYSSGMYLRLAFAVAAHLEPEILIVDEVLAVGDAAFQKKCLGKMGDVAKEGRTVLLVSHNMEAVAKLTTRAVLLQGGQVTAQGQTSSVIFQYLASDENLQAEWQYNGRSVDKDVLLTAVRVCNLEGCVTPCFSADEAFTIQIEFTVAHESYAQIAFRLNSCTDGSTILTSAISDQTNDRAMSFRPGRYRASCYVPAHTLRPGNYCLLVAANNPRGPQFDLVDNILNFEITTIGSLINFDGRLGVIVPLLKWDLNKQQLDQSTTGSIARSSIEPHWDNSSQEKRI